MSQPGTSSPVIPSPPPKAQRPGRVAKTSSTGSTSTIRPASPQTLSPDATPMSEGPSTTSSKTPSPLSKAVSLPDDQPRPHKSRGRSFSNSKSASQPDVTNGAARVGTYPASGHSSSLSFSSLKARSSSPGAKRLPSPGRIADIASLRADTPPGAPSKDQWNKATRSPRGWDETEPKRKRTVPGEQVVALQHTRERVASAAKSVLGAALSVTHEALVLSVDLLQLAPVPGLAEAAKTLLNIWDALEAVDSNRMACLRLTERCADILLGVRDEIVDAGTQVALELRDPIFKLVSSFVQVRQFMTKQAGRSFLMRYLKRDEIRGEIFLCDQSLSDSLYLFSTSIQIRILKQVQASRPTGGLNTSTPTLDRPLPPLPPLGWGDSTSKSTETLMPITFPEPEGPYELPSVAPPSPEALRAQFSEHISKQNYYDQEMDDVDMRTQMRDTMRAPNDVELLESLEVPRTEIPDVLKTLQRALEREVDREVNVETSEREQWANSVRIVRKAASIESFDSETSEVPSLTDSWLSSDGSSGSRSKPRRDTLDREFMECGIDALRRLSKGAQYRQLPSWAITKYEITRDTKIGFGSFSDVYRGTWRGRTVAIKILLESTPAELFVKEIEIWKKLQHRNVLCLFGASSATGEPPYFFVSPYYKNGNLAKYLQGLSALSATDVLRMFHEIAKGMQYLHSKSVLHGDLKASNILVDDKNRCVIADFGQSELKSEAYRRSGTPQIHEGALRWQAPELMQGHSHLTPEMDVYSFAICCVEILGRGSVPWAVQDDLSVYHLVVALGRRPPIPELRPPLTDLNELIQQCWNHEPTKRPPFTEVAARLKQLRAKSTFPFVDEPSTPDIVIEEPEMHMSPSTLPIDLPEEEPLPSWPVTVPGSYPGSNPLQTVIQSSGIGNGGNKDSPFSRQGSLSSEIASDELSDTDGHQLDASGFLSPLPEDSPIRLNRDERRYRILLQHEFHPTLTLPLWTPSPVRIGTVGYLEKPAGKFVPLFDAFNPSAAANNSLRNAPSIYGYGHVKKGLQRAEKRNPAQRGLDSIQHWYYSKFTGHGSQTASRQYTYQLRADHKAAFLTTETTVYNYLDNLDAPKRWFKASIDTIVRVYGASHNLRREDVLLVVGTLDTPEYAQRVCHSHPDGQLHFNVFAAATVDRPWGEYVQDLSLSPALAGGPSYNEAAIPTDATSKVSNTQLPTASWNSVLLARLRFKTDAVEPTSR